MRRIVYRVSFMSLAICATPTVCQPSEKARGGSTENYIYPSNAELTRTCAKVLESNNYPAALDRTIKI